MVYPVRKIEITVIIKSIGGTMSYPDERISETPLDPEEYAEFVEHLRVRGKLFWDELLDKDTSQLEWFRASQLNFIHLLLFSILRTNVEIWSLLKKWMDDG